MLTKDRADLLQAELVQRNDFRLVSENGRQDAPRFLLVLNIYGEPGLVFPVQTSPVGMGQEVGTRLEGGLLSVGSRIPAGRQPLRLVDVLRGVGLVRQDGVPLLIEV